MEEQIDLRTSGEVDKDNYRGMRLLLNNRCVQFAGARFFWWILAVLMMDGRHVTYCIVNEFLKIGEEILLLNSFVSVFHNTMNHFQVLSKGICKTLFYNTSFTEYFLSSQTSWKSLVYFIGSFLKILINSFTNFFTVFYSKGKHDIYFGNKFWVFYIKNKNFSFID